MEEKKVFKLLNKRELTLKEIRLLTDYEEVSSIEVGKSDRKFYYKYNVRLDNGELYFVYVKKSIFNIINEISHNKN